MCCLRKKVEKYCKAGQTIDYSITQRLGIACSVIKTTNTHSEYEILITIKLQQWSHERSSLLHYI